jgi:hypothetical protein
VGLKKERRNSILIGVDFDGVITQNPLRAARVLVAIIKHRILRKRKLSFFVPKGKIQRMIYYIGVIAPNIWPADGIDLLKAMSKTGDYTFVLVTGRYGFVERQTIDWIKKYGLVSSFQKIFINVHQEQPHEFKKRIISKEKFDYYIEDNWDIVRKLTDTSKTKIFWISNFLDMRRSYLYKFSSLKLALKQIKDENEVAYLS